MNKKMFISVPIHGRDDIHDVFAEIKIIDEEWWLEEDEQDTIEDQRATWRSEWNMYCSREDN